MAWTIERAREVAGIADDTYDDALQLTMDIILAEAEGKLERGLLLMEVTEDFFDLDYCRLYLPRYPVVEVASPTVTRLNKVRGWIEGWGSAVVNCKLTVQWTGGYDPAELPADLEAALWGAFLARWNNVDPDTGGLIASSVAAQGTGEVKSLTVFDAYKVDYDIGGSGASFAAETQNFWGIFAPWADTMIRYRRNVGGA